MPVRGLRSGVGGGSSHPFGRAGRTRVSCGARGLNQDRRPSCSRCEQETRHRSELALACTSRPLVERKLGGGWRVSCGVRQLFVDVVGLVGEAADLAVARP